MAAQFMMWGRLTPWCEHGRVLKLVITGSDSGDRGFIRRIIESSVAGAFRWDRDGDRQGTGEAFVAQMGDWGGGDLNMHGYFNALGAPNLDVSTPYS